MKNFLLFTFFSFITFVSVSAQCNIENSDLNSPIQSGDSGVVTAELKGFDPTQNPSSGTIPATADWIVSCNNCTIDNIVGGETGNFGIFIEYTATSGENMSISLTAFGNSCTDGVQKTIIAEVLPVELAYFEGESKGADISLNWMTTMELNNDYFTVERSFDGKDFTAVTKIAGAGDSEEDVNYSFSDENVTRIATANTAYYRLKQTDFDGAFTYSDVISVNLKNRADLEVTNVAVAGNELSVNFVAPTEGTTEISVYDLTGRMIARAEQVAIEGYNTTTLDLNTAQSGIFIVRITNGHTQTVRKVFK